MKEADKAKLESKLMKVALWFAPRAGNPRYVVAVRMSNGSTMPIAFAAKPDAEGWKRTKALLAQRGVLMAIVVDVKKACDHVRDNPKRAPDVHFSGMQESCVLYRYVTPKWGELTSIPGAVEAWQARAAQFQQLVLPWAT